MQFLFISTYKRCENFNRVTKVEVSDTTRVERRCAAGPKKS
jgi:hypothetical protein